MSVQTDSMTIQHDGVTTHYLQAGPSPEKAAGTVLLVHDGWYGADAETLWSGVLPLLARDHHVLAPDMLGFGRTDKAVFFDRSMYAYRSAHLGSFTRAVLGGAVRVHGVGVSMGGSILLRDAVAEDARIPLASVVSISGSGGPWRSAFGAEELGRYDGTRDDIERILRHMADPFPGWDEVIAQRQANTERRGHVQALLAGSVKHPNAAAGGAPADSWPEQLASTSVPVLVVECERDPLLEQGWSQHLQGLGELVRTTTLDARHAPPLDRPSEVAYLVAQHVQDSSRALSGQGA